MVQLIVREVDDDIARALKERAAANGRSAEAEHRMILREVLQPTPDMTTLRRPQRGCVHDCTPAPTASS